MRLHRIALAACLATMLSGTGRVVAQDNGKLTRDLAAVPPDALAFAHVRLADVWKTDAFKEVRETVLRAGEEALRAFDQRFVPAPSTIDRLTMFVTAPEGGGRGEPGVVFVVTTTKPFARDQFLKQTAPEAKKGRGDLYVDEQNRMGIYFLGEQMIAFGPAPGMAAWLGRERPARGPLSEGIALAATGKPLVIAANPAAIPAEVLGQLPPPLRAILRAKLVLLSFDLTGNGQIDLKMAYADAQQAQAAEEGVKQGVAMARDAMSKAKAEMQKMLLGDGKPAALSELPEAAGGLFGLGVIQRYEDILTTLPLKRSGESLVLSAQLPPGGGTFLGAGAMSVGLLLPAVQKVREAAARAQSMNNLRQIGIAMHNHEAVYRKLPAGAICDKEGKPLLSWRVTILPYMEQENLYKQFNLDEPWDSEHNKKLIPLMPKFCVVPAAPMKPGETYYRMFVGGGAMFELNKGTTFAQVSDGLSNTFMAVEADESVPWTKPDELAFDPKKPLPKLGSFYSSGGFVALMGDGSAKFISKSISDANLRRAVMRADGEIVNLDE